MNDIHHLPGKAEAKAVIRQHRKASFYVKKYLMIFMGALIAAIGLELFLIPNNVIDGGVVGIALMAAQVTGISFSVFIIILNIPFFIFGYKKIGAFFTISSLFSILCLSGWSTFIHYERVTSDPFLSTIYGGIIIGLGVGLIIRWGGSLDGTEVLAIIDAESSRVTDWINEDDSNSASPPPP